MWGYVFVSWWGKNRKLKMENYESVDALFSKRVSFLVTEVKVRVRFGFRQSTD